MGNRVEGKEDQVGIRTEKLNDWECEDSKKWDVYIFRFTLILFWIWNYSDIHQPVSKGLAVKAISVMDYFIKTKEAIVLEIQQLAGEKLPKAIMQKLLEVKLN